MTLICRQDSPRSNWMSNRKCQNNSGAGPESCTVWCSRCLGQQQNVPATRKDNHKSYSRWEDFLLPIYYKSCIPLIHMSANASQFLEQHRLKVKVSTLFVHVNCVLCFCNILKQPGELNLLIFGKGHVYRGSSKACVQILIRWNGLVGCQLFN